MVFSALLLARRPEVAAAARLAPGLLPLVVALARAARGLEAAAPEVLRGFVVLFRVAIGISCCGCSRGTAWMDLSELHASELHASELHASELHASELHASELHASELRA